VLSTSKAEASVQGVAAGGPVGTGCGSANSGSCCADAAAQRGRQRALRQPRDAGRAAGVLPGHVQPRDSPLGQRPRAQACSASYCSVACAAAMRASRLGSSCSSLVNPTGPLMQICAGLLHEVACFLSSRPSQKEAPAGRQGRAREHVGGSLDAPALGQGVPGRRGGPLRRERQLRAQHRARCAAAHGRHFRRGRGRAAGRAQRARCARQCQATSQPPACCAAPKACA